MPLLVAPVSVTPPTEPPPTPRPPVKEVDYLWTSPSGETLPMSDSTSVVILAGGDGEGATPRQVTRRPLATGGTMARWSHADERILAYPLRFHADSNQALTTLKRRVARLFTQTTPPAGIPRTGVLRKTRADGTWREISCIYEDGLSWPNEAVAGPLIDRTVLQLVACDPWWYSAAVVALDFADSTTLRTYLNPYETVSTGRTLGEVTVNIMGEIPVDPVWTITGPADSVTVRYETAGPGWTFGAIAAGETITIDVDASTVTDNTGANRIGKLVLPSSSLFQLQPGPNDLLLSIGGGTAGVSNIRLVYRPRWDTS